MTDSEALQARIDELEARIAHQDRTLEDLNDAVVAQWKTIDALVRRLAVLTDRVQEAEARAGTSARPEPPPPHY